VPFIIKRFADRFWLRLARDDENAGWISAWKSKKTSDWSRCEGQQRNKNMNVCDLPIAEGSKLKDVLYF
jgi:hypothetical protein